MFKLLLVFIFVCLQLNWMDDSIINSAKTILARQMRGKTSTHEDGMDKMKQLEDMVSSQSAAVKRLEEKLDKLLRLRI